VSVAIVKNNLGQLGKFDFMWDGLTGQIRSMTNDERNQYELVLQRIEDEKQAEEEEKKKGWWKGNDDEI
jgi:DNA replication initiation complex subunit (GINS family)